MEKIKILLASYFMVWAVQWVDSSLDRYSVYYFMLSITAFCLAVYCFKSSDKLIKGYAIIQFIALFSYVHMIIPENFSTLEYWFYDSIFSFGNIILMYELLLLVSGAWDAYNVCDWLDNDWYSLSRNNK